MANEEAKEPSLTLSLLLSSSLSPPPRRLYAVAIIGFLFPTKHFFFSSLDTAHLCCSRCAHLATFFAHCKSVTQRKSFFFSFPVQLLEHSLWMMMNFDERTFDEAHKFSSTRKTFPPSRHFFFCISAKRVVEGKMKEKGRKIRKKFTANDDDDTRNLCWANESRTDNEASVSQTMRCSAREKIFSRPEREEKPIARVFPQMIT